ncbi:PIG-L family deacetylase [Streptomyces sp. AV19]|uniref:PIG-L family deacetylase n=1 Tax=Streptomyces sp. AV19 TaxID=2793068 RepID=UPI0018FE8A07|nr:PIG-L family deacetylase [Streptomyces sp. AV19]MBH1939021.1 PIG-L family deacetylase [Streptomyces sp. AV19]MDG4532462.1 PIG-L family deacetylase [Streptomyces sp. AV19]
MSQHIPRRRVLQAAGGGVAATTSLTGVWQWLVPRKEDDAEGPTLPPKAIASESFVYVIAHPDDSLYFMNPDMEQALLAGAPTTTVCLTGGESDGRNALTKQPGYRQLPKERAAFVRARINGLRRAMAKMATGDPSSSWDISTLSLLKDFGAELHTLRSAPQVQLIFLELIEARSMRSPHKESLRGLWLGATPQLPTLRPAASPVTRIFQYGRRNVIDTLTAVFERYRPTVVRTLDPNPTHLPRQPHYERVPPVLKGPAFYDHQDHTASAHFVQAALAQYWGRKHARPTVVESYIGYEVSRLPSNLDTGATRHKTVFLDIYGWADGVGCGDPAGCGDRKVGSRSKDTRWTNNCRHRSPGTTRWVQLLPDGRLTAFALFDGRAHCWTETAPGSCTWSSPVAVGGSMLEGHVQAVLLADGRLQLVSVRTVLPERGEPHRREVVTAVQEGKPAGSSPSFGPWRSLGSPEDDPQRSMEMGYPVAVVDKAGTVHVVVRTWAGGLSIRSSIGPRGWTDWRQLSTAGSSTMVPDGLDAAVDGHGRLHIVAADARTLHHWTAETSGAEPRLMEPTRLPAATGPITLAPLVGEGVRLATRQPGTSRVVIADWRPGRGWRQTVQCRTVGGHGRVALAQTRTSTVLAARDAEGRVRLAAGPGRPGDWSRSGVPHLGTPGVTLDGEGRPVVVVLGADGKLSSCRHRGPDKKGFTPWVTQEGKKRPDPR